MVHRLLYPKYFIYHVPTNAPSLVIFSLFEKCRGKRWGRSTVFTLRCVELGLLSVPPYVCRTLNSGDRRRERDRIISFDLPFLFNGSEEHAPSMVTKDLSQYSLLAILTLYRPPVYRPSPRVHGLTGSSQDLRTVLCLRSEVGFSH